MNEGEANHVTTSVPGVPESVQKLPSDVMQVSEQMILLTWLAFGVAAFCLHKLLWKPILRAVESREATITEALDGAERARQEVVVNTARGRQILDEASEQARSAVEHATKESSAMLARADQKAKALAQRRIDEAEREIEVEVNKAAEAVRQDTAKNIGDLVERLLMKNLTDEQKRAYQSDILREVKL